MNIILHFAILCVCVVHVRSMRKEAPSLNNLLFVSELSQKPQHLQTKNEIKNLPETSIQANNEINVSDALLDQFSSHKEQKAEKASKASSSNTEKYIDVSEMLHDLTAAQEKQTGEQETQVPKPPSKTFKEIELSEVLKNLFPHKNEEVKVVPESHKIADKEFDISELLRDLFSAPEKQVVKQEAEAPSSTDEEINLSGMLHELTSAQKKQTVEQETQVPKPPSKSFKEIELYEVLKNLFPNKDEEVKVVPESPKIADKEFDVSELLRDIFSGPENQVMKQEAKVPSSTDEEINVSEMLRDLFTQNEQEVSKSPTNTNSVPDVSELFLGSISAPEEQAVGQVPKATINMENEIDIAKLLNDLISPRNEEFLEVVPIASPKIGNESEIPVLLIEIISPPKEPEETVLVEIDDEIISIIPLNDSTTDEKEENSPKPNLTTKLNELISDVIAPLEQRLLDEFERALVPLNDIIELGADIKNSPFTEEEIKKLGWFKVCMQTTQEAFSEFKSQVRSFGANRFYETAVHTHYHLSKEQKNHTINVLNDATERVKAESKAIYDLILKRENQQLIKSIENKKLELSASLRAISLALKANYAHLIDDNKMEEVKTKRLSIIEENSKSMIEILQSKTFESLKDGIIEHVDKLVDIMNKLPMKITLSYMF